MYFNNTLIQHNCLFKCVFMSDSSECNSLRLHNIFFHAQTLKHKAQSHAIRMRRTSSMARFRKELRRGTKVKCVGISECIWNTTMFAAISTKSMLCNAFQSEAIVIILFNRSNFYLGYGPILSIGFSFLHDNRQFIAHGISLGRISRTWNLRVQVI